VQHRLITLSEIRNVVYTKLAKSDEVGSDKLRFLAVCSQIHAEATKMAWSGTLFKYASLDRQSFRTRLSNLSTELKANIAMLDIGLIEIVTIEKGQYCSDALRLWQGDGDIKICMDHLCSLIRDASAASLRQTLKDELPNLSVLVIPFTLKREQPQLRFHYRCPNQESAEKICDYASNHPKHKVTLRVDSLEGLSRLNLAFVHAVVQAQSDSLAIVIPEIGDYLVGLQEPSGFWVLLKDQSTEEVVHVLVVYWPQNEGVHGMLKGHAW
jgi:hypothetical protein